MPVLFRAGVIGLTAGLRSIVAPAAVSWAMSTGRLNTPRGLDRAADPRLATVLLLGGLIEIVNDKMPLIPPRTNPPIAAWRLATGAVLGGALAASEGESAIAGAAAGGAGAVIGTYGGYAARSRLSRLIPEPFAGTLEDALMIALALLNARG